MKKAYVSNSEQSIKLFENNLMNALSKVHFTIPLFIYIPVITYLSYLSFVKGIDAGDFFIYFIPGLFVWTITEYLLHLFIFHYPGDKMRLVMPPSESIPLAVAFYFLFSFIFEFKFLLAFFPGFLSGVYNMLHNAMHHRNFKSGILKKMKHHHMLHHYQDESKDYGESFSLWDINLKSDFSKKTNNT